jgi:hypothetical protein
LIGGCHLLQPPIGGPLIDYLADLRELLTSVHGVRLCPMKATSVSGERDQQPIAGSCDPRQRVRTCDLSRVKREGVTDR